MVPYRKMKYPGVAQLVARLLWEQDAAGSNPVTRTTSSRTMYRSRRLFLWKVIGSLTPSLLLSAKSHARRTCSVINDLATVRCCYQLFYGIQECKSFSKKCLGVHFVAPSQTSGRQFIMNCRPLFVQPNHERIFISSFHITASDAPLAVIF